MEIIIQLVASWFCLGVGAGLFIVGVWLAWSFLSG